MELEKGTFLTRLPAIWLASMAGRSFFLLYWMWRANNVGWPLGLMVKASVFVNAEDGGSSPHRGRFFLLYVCVCHFTLAIDTSCDCVARDVCKDLSCCCVDGSRAMITLDEFCFYLVLAAFVRVLPSLLWLFVGEDLIFGV